MDLWILTQDEKKLIKVDYIEINLFTSSLCTKNEITLATYKTSIRCQEIFTHIKAILKRTEKTVYVYEMPKE